VEQIVSPRLWLISGFETERWRSAHRRTPMSEDPRYPEIGKALEERAQGQAERALLGRSPMGTMLRITLLVLIFILLGGTVFYLLRGQT
jgi:hypothetical protein